jgi:DUF1009 family protein
MLARCGDFATDRKWFVKTSKPRQDFRFDAPVIGMRTLEILRDARIDAVAVEADRTILLDKKNLVHRANQLAIGLYGY